MGLVFDLFKLRDDFAIDESDDEALQRETADAQEMAAAARQALSTCAGELADLRVHEAEVRQRLEETEREKQRLSGELEAAKSAGSTRAPPL